MDQNPLTQKSAAWLGFRNSSPFILIIVPFGILFGAVATEAGFNLLQVMSFSVLVIAGSSQFTAISLMTENAPTLIVLATALAVNLRMAMYSAGMLPHFGSAPIGWRIVFAYFLVDQTYALMDNKFTKSSGETWQIKAAYFLGAAALAAPCWYAATLLGALLGSAIPEEFALDFAVPICFIALSAPLIRSIPHAVAAFVSVTGSLLFAGVPNSLGLIIAALLAMMAGAYSETVMDRKRA